MHQQEWRPINTCNWPLYISMVLSLFIHSVAFLHTPEKEIVNIGATRLEIYLTTTVLTRTQVHKHTQTLTPSENTPSRPYQSLARKPPTTAEKQPNRPRDIFFPTYIMDRPPFPVSAPTPQVYLEKTEMPATLVRVRLYIDDKGRVVDVIILAPNEISKIASQQIREMFFATSFVPGHINDTDLPCLMDIEIDLASYVE